MKSLSVSIPLEDYEFVKYALDQLSSEVCTGGQRGHRRSILIKMIAIAAIADFKGTVRLMKEIEALAKKQYSLLI